MKRSKFSLSNYKLLSCNMGELIPIGLMDVLPGDSIQQSTQALVRATPLLAPVMHPVHVSIRHFFVPFRLLWDDWEEFITGGPDGMDDSAFPTLLLKASNSSNIVGELGDYLGCPPDVDNLEVSALPFRAYNLIWNEFYRDQDLQTERALTTVGGLDTFTAVWKAQVNWEKDYFTSARPWEQKGPSVTIPIGTTAPISGLGTATTGSSVAQSGIRESDGSTVSYTAGYKSDTAPLAYRTKTLGASAFPDIYADLSTASSVTVRALREAMALQRYEEARARFGSRYTEYLRYLGVQSSDARLQRPEYLGGGRQTIQFSEVLATAEGTDTNVGDLKGHGIAAMRSNRYRRFFEEHGLIMSLMYIRPKTIYMQGLARHWNKRTKWDYWQKEIQHVGQQQVNNKEILASHSLPNNIFGYQDRYDEYRRTESTVAGEFRTSALDHWHLARSFASDVALNGSFVTCLPSERIFAENTQNTMYVMAHNSIQARRLVASQGMSFIF